jgi:murein DD-endopeptidase
LNLIRVWFMAAASLALLVLDVVPLIPAAVISKPASSAAADAHHEKDARSETSRPLTAPLDISVPAKPWAFRANNKWHLVYELHIANIGNENCTLKQIEVLEPGSNTKPLASITGKDLDAAIVHPWVEESAPATLGPATVAVVFMWVTVDRGEDIPASLSHRITMNVGNYPEGLSITMPSLEVNRNPVPVIGPPLRGENWGAAHGPDNDSRHRRGLLTINGRSYLAERFAIDWVRITSSGDDHSGSGSVNNDYPGYGANVIAVADGVITEVLDGIPENVPGQSPSVPITLQNICGNHIIQLVGPNLYASYCHLQSGIRVRSGTKVKRGQVLALLGNSGSSDGPHLHFHLCNANSTLACEGIPYAFSSFVEEHRGFNSPNGAPQPDAVHSMEIPTDQTLVDFR